MNNVLVHACVGVVTKSRFYHRGSGHVLTLWICLWVDHLPTLCTLDTPSIDRRTSLLAGLAAEVRLAKLAGSMPRLIVNRSETPPYIPKFGSVYLFVGNHDS